MAVFKLLKGGRCKCGAGAESDRCDCPRDERYTFSFRFRGTQYTRRTDATTKAKALEIEKAFLKGLQGERCDEVLAFLNSDAARMRRVCASIGEVRRAYEAKFHVWMGSKGGAIRNSTDLALVCAYGLNLWTINEGGRKGVKMGASVPDLERIDALSSSVLTPKLVTSYFLARQREAGIASDDVVWLPNRKNESINRTLKHVRALFCEDAHLHAFKHLSLPDLKPFMKAPLLRTKAKLPEPFTQMQFATLCRRVQALRRSDPDLWLLNVIHRQTGLRPRYVMSLRGSWLEQGEGGQWMIKICDRDDEGWEKKEGTLNQFIPLSPALARVILARGMGLTVAGGDTETKRGRLQKRHNRLIKEVAGNVGSHEQASYRYRDTVASVLGFLKGVKGAQEALGHACELTTLKHYCRALSGVSKRMRFEMRAWL
jgi:hypothetical protein